MTQDDQQPPEPTSEGRISRDTLLLLGALAFLIVAVALTFLFTPNSGTNVGQSGATATSIVAATGPAGEPYPLNTPAGVATPGPAVSYPGPGAGGIITTTQQPGTVATGAPEAEPSPTRAGNELAPSPQATATTAAYPGPVGEGTPPPVPTFNPTVIQPTAPPPPTSAPPVAIQPTVAPPVQPLPTGTSPADLEFEASPTAPPATPTTPPPPPPPPADVLRGNVRWSAGQSPIVLRRDLQIAPGAELIIEPGVEVRLDPGVSIYVDGGRLLALGQPGQPVRFVGSSGARWSGIFGRPNSFVLLEHSEVRGGGIGGTVMALDRSELVVRNSRFTDNGGAILTTDTRLEMRDSEVAGNDMPFGAALEAGYERGNFVTLTGNRFGGNRLSDGSPQVRISSSSSFDTLNLAIDGNLISGGAPNLQLTTNGPLRGAVVCNTLVGADQGFGLRTLTEQVAPNGAPPMELRVEQNYIDEHTPPIIPIYLRFGLGRGATSEIKLDMRNNWWGDPSGPYDPERNVDGRGDSVGVNIEFVPWLQAPPPCTPPR